MLSKSLENKDQQLASALKSVENFDDAARSAAEDARAKLEEIRALEKKLASAESSTNATTRAFAVAEQEIGEALTQVQILRSERETAEAEVERLNATLASVEDAKLEEMFDIGYHTKNVDAIFKRVFG